MNSGEARDRCESSKNYYPTVLHACFCVSTLV